MMFLLLGSGFRDMGVFRCHREIELGHERENAMLDLYGVRDLSALVVVDGAVQIRHQR